MPLTASCTVLATDHATWIEQVSKELRKLTKRQQCFAEGVFIALEPPALLDKLTDELLVVAVDAVEAAVAEHGGLGVDGKPLSGRAKLRLLAWVVADARGAGTRLEPAAQVKILVGKR